MTRIRMHYLLIVMLPSLGNYTCNHSGPRNAHLQDANAYCAKGFVNFWAILVYLWLLFFRCNFEVVLRGLRLSVWLWWMLIQDGKEKREKASDSERKRNIGLVMVCGKQIKALLKKSGNKNQDGGGGGGGGIQVSQEDHPLITARKWWQWLNN